MADEKVEFELVSPAKLLLSEAVEMVVVPGGEGDFGVMPGHTPLLSTVRPGTIDIWGEGKVQSRLFVEGGFAEVTAERCTVLAEAARPLDEISRDEADERLQRANETMMAAETDGERRGAERELRAAEAMVAAVESREKDKH
ncbi:MAG: ATP synthase F1 subunit epsilon [Rhodospirillales bacterium]|nr:ATP synthase F1 subunit epsilon [Rhodospirillales bacterium]